MVPPSESAAESVAPAATGSNGIRTAWPAVTGALVGALAWGGWSLAQPTLPGWLRFIVAGCLFLFGPGSAATWPVLTRMPAVPRLIFAFGFGVIAAPALAHALSLAGVVSLYPYIAAALAGATATAWRRLPRGPLSRRELMAPLLLILLTFGLCYITYANRVTVTPESTTYHGEYDAYDVTYYAAIAAELSHAIPPSSPFQAGRPLNHSFYPQVVPALIHRFADVPLLDMYFGFIWPGFLALTALTCFAFVERVTTTRVGLLAALLLVVGSDLSYLATWLYPLIHQLDGGWDNVIWSANFLSPGAETLLFNNWAPAMIVVFVGFYALASAERDDHVGWPLAAGVSFGVAVLFKPFTYALLLAGLGGATLSSWRDTVTRSRLILVGVITTVLGAPYVYRVLTLIDDAQVTLMAEPFLLPRILLRRLAVDRDLFAWAAGYGIEGTAALVLVGLIGTPIFILGGLGFRAYALPGIWRCLRHPGGERPIWRVVAWTITASTLIPFVIVTLPYYETMHIYQLAIFLFPVFVARAVGRRPTRAGQIAAASVLIAISLPTTVNYLQRKWHERDTHAYGIVFATQLPVVELLRQSDHERTIVLHSRPRRDTLLGILYERRSVLAWGDYVRGSEEARAAVERFFQSADRPAAVAFDVLRRYRPTHVIEQPGVDHIHPEVMKILQPLFRNDDIALYAVPEAYTSGEPR